MATGKGDNVAMFFEHGIDFKTKTLSLMDREITSEVADRVVGALHILATRTDKGKALHVLLNTAGGDWAAGMAIYDMLRLFPSEVEILMLGEACSMGSILLQAADYRLVGANSLFMIHDGEGIAAGSPKSIQNWADLETKVLLPTMYEIYLDRFRAADPVKLADVLNKKLPEGAAKIYPKRGINVGHVRALCSQDTWFTAQELVDVNLADKIL